MKKRLNKMVTIILVFAIAVCNIDLFSVSQVVFADVVHFPNDVILRTLHHIDRPTEISEETESNEVYHQIVIEKDNDFPFPYIIDGNGDYLFYEPAEIVFDYAFSNKSELYNPNPGYGGNISEMFSVAVLIHNKDTDEIMDIGNFKNIDASVIVNDDNSFKIVINDFKFPEKSHFRVGDTGSSEKRNVQDFIKEAVNSNNYSVQMVLNYSTIITHPKKDKTIYYLDGRDVHAGIENSDIVTIYNRPEGDVDRQKLNFIANRDTEESSPVRLYKEIADTIVEHSATRMGVGDNVFEVVLKFDFSDIIFFMGEGGGVDGLEDGARIHPSSSALLEIPLSEKVFVHGEDTFSGELDRGVYTELNKDVYTNFNNLASVFVETKNGKQELEDSLFYVKDDKEFKALLINVRPGGRPERIYGVELRYQAKLDPTANIDELYPVNKTSYAVFNNQTFQAGLVGDNPLHEVLNDPFLLMKIFNGEFDADRYGRVEIPTPYILKTGSTISLDQFNDYKVNHILEEGSISTLKHTEIKNGKVGDRTSATEWTDALAQGMKLTRIKNTYIKKALNEADYAVAEVFYKKVPISANPTYKVKHVYKVGSIENVLKEVTKTGISNTMTNVDSLLSDIQLVEKGGYTKKSAEDVLITVDGKAVAKIFYDKNIVKLQADSKEVEENGMLHSVTTFSSDKTGVFTKLDGTKLEVRGEGKLTGNYTVRFLDKPSKVKDDSNKVYFAEYKDGLLVIKKKGESTNKENGKTPSYTPPSKKQNPPKLNKKDHFAYLQGYPDDTIRPNGYLTREEAVVIFFRLLDPTYRDSIRFDKNNFKDVESFRWSNKHISTLVKGEIIKGYEDGTFRPSDYITRAEIATIATKFDKLNFTDNKFKDVENHWAEQFISSAVDKGWVYGYNDNTFKPNDYITRAEFAVLVNNVLDRHVEFQNILQGTRVFKDLPEIDNWYYCPIKSASSTYEYENYNKNGLIYQKWENLKENTHEM